MANQQVGVNMKFTADTSQAKTQLQDLQSSLTRIMDVSRKNDPTLGFSKEIQNAINLTAELKTSLTNATNVKTGQLDLSKFNDSLVKNKRTLKDYQNALTSLGPAGNQAFSDLASSIMKAEIPLKRTNKLLADFAITMKNTVKWQISSNIMHGLEGSIKSAYGYAQDLNKSLNDIRIVTGASVNEMARFAEQANKSARALSTTTTDYTKASLIYYQQGLSDSEVQERTDVTIKMANVARESAEIVSDQMTAVWNNFDDGSKSLEYYADVMTALGAATASSTDEIAAGLEKFAAVSETVGLSYEYATAALATVTDKTRQSADVVGTAFKAMFARIQGLKLGKTLEDGTDLNQYSKALLAVGVNIKDANGELKDMDSILSEMAAVWEKLNRDEQVALAQKVAGIRQYNQLMSLMENWDAMEINLEVAKNSEGELQKQADIYAESWEAATDRVKAAAESIYQTLINDEFFIDLTNALEKILVGVKKLMDSMGGLSGVLTLVGSIATNVFNKQLADGFDNLIYRIRMSTDEGRKEIEDLKHEASQLLTAEWTDRDTTSGLIAGNAYKEQGQLQGILLANAEKLSAEEQKQVQYLMDQHSSLVSQVVKSGEALEIEQQKAKLLERRMIAEAQLAAGERSNHKVSGVEVHRKSLEGITELYYKISSISLTGNMEKDAQSFQRLNKIIAELKGNTVQLGKEGQLAVNQLANGLKNGTLTAKDLDNILLQLEKQQVISMNGLITALEKCGIEGKDATNIARQLRDQYDNLGVASAETSEKQIQLGNSTKSVADKIKNAKGEIVTLGSMFSSTMNAVTNFGFALSSIKGIIDTLNNEDLTFFEKLVSVLISTSMIIGSFTSILKTVNDIRKMATSGEIKNTTAKTLNAAATWLQAKAEKALGDELDRNNKKKTTSSKINLKDAKNTGKRVSVKLIEKTGQASQNAAGAVNTLGAAFGNFVSSLKGVLPLLGKYIAIAAVVVAVISAVTYAIHKRIEKLNEDSIAAKEAAEHADLMAEKYNKLAEEANKFKESVSNYDTAVESLKKLEKGTDEYKDAIAKANEEAQKLIELYGLWDKVKGYDENGLIVFKDNALQGVQAEKDTAANNAKWEADAARIGSIYKDIQEVSGQVARDVGLVIEDGKKRGKQNTTVTNFRQLNQNELGEIAGVFGQLDNIQQMSDDALRTFLENSNSLSSHLKDIIPNIIKNREAFENLSKVLNTSASELEFKTKELISGTIDKQFDSKIDDMSVNPNTGEVDEGRRAQILNAAATGLYQFEMNKEQGLATQLSEIDVKDVSNTRELQEYEQYKDVTNDEELARKYAEVILGKSADNLQYVKGLGEGGLKDENGNTVLDTTDDKYMRRRLAQYAEEQNIKDSYEASDTEYRTQYMSALEDLVAGGDTLGAELGTDLTGALLESLQSGVGTLDLTSIFGGLNEGERDSLINLDENQLAEKLGMTPEKLKTLGFESAEAFETAFDNSLRNWTPELAKENFLDDLTSKTSEDAKAFGLDPEMLQEVAEGFADMAEAGEEGYDSLNENAELASDAATRYVRLQDAVLDLSDNYDDYADVLKGVRSASDKVDKGYAANSESGKKLKKSLAGLLGTTEDLIDADLLEAIDPGDFKAAAAGDEAAIGRIRDSFMQLQAEANGIDFTKLKEEIDGLDEGANLDLNTDSFLSQLIAAKLEAGATADDIEHMLSGLGIDMDTIQFYDSLGAAELAAQKTGGIIVDALSFSQQTTTDATEIQKNNEENGFTEHIRQDTISDINEVTETMEDGTIVSKQIPSVIHSFTKTVTDNPIPTTSSETVTNTEQKTTNGAGKTGNAPPKKAAVITGKKSIGGRVSPGTVNRARGGGGKGGKGGGGGGGSKPKPAKPTKKSDIVDRYKEQDDQLDDLKRTMDNAEKSLERLYGEDKIKAIEKLIAAEREYKDVLKEKRSEARDALKEDRKALNAAASKVSVEFEYDAEGNIINYTEQMEALYNRLRAVEKAAGPEWTESEQEQIDALKEKIEALKEAQEQYESTRELIEDISDELKDLAGKPAMPLIKSDYIDIYKEIIDALDDIDKRLERLAKRADDLMGSKRLKQFKQFEGTSEEKLALIDEELSKNKTDIGQNKTYLKKVSKLLGVDAPKYDKKGNIVNSNEVLDVLWQRVLKVQKRAKKDGKISENEQKVIDSALSDVEMYTSARDKYSDAVEYRKDLNAEKKEITDKVTVLPVVTNDFLDIYKEADDILDDIEHKASKIADESERATGKDKVAKLKELAKTEKERYQYIKKAQEINTSDKAEKKAAMESAASSLKIPIKFAYDGNGNITNYNEIKQYYEQQYAAAYAEAMKDGFINADEREIGRAHV